MSTDEECRLVGLGSSLVRIILHEDGKFYREDDINKGNPLNALLISNGSIAIYLWAYNNDEYGPPKKYEMDYELGKQLEILVDSKDTEGKQFGVTIDISGLDIYNVDFYRIVN